MQLRNSVEIILWRFYKRNVDNSENIASLHMFTCVYKYICVFVRAYACAGLWKFWAYARICSCACVRVQVWMPESMWLRVCLQISKHASVCTCKYVNTSMLANVRVSVCALGVSKAWFTPNTHAHAIDSTQIFYNDKPAEYSNRSLNHLRSALFIMTKELMMEANIVWACSTVSDSMIESLKARCEVVTSCGQLFYAQDAMSIPANSSVEKSHMVHPRHKNWGKRELEQHVWTHK